MGHEIRDLGRSISLDSAGNDFIKYAKTIAAARGQIGEAQRLASRVAPGRVRDTIELLERNPIHKTAVGVTGLSEALAPYRVLADGFFASMAEFSGFSRVYNDCYHVPLRTILAVLTSAPTGAAVSEIAAKPLSSGGFATARLEPSKVTSLIVITNELARSVSPAAIQQFGNELRRAASIAVDQAFLSMLAATPGASSAASTGITASAVLNDLTARVQSLTIGADSRLWWIVSPKLFKTLSLLQGVGGFLMINNRIGQINVAPSDAASTVATLIDARQIAAQLDTITVDSSESASLALSDNPTSTGYQTVSLFQQNMTALRAEMWFGALALRSTAVSLLTGYA